MGIDRQTDRDRQRQRQRDGDRNRQTEREGEREREKARSLKIKNFKDCSLVSFRPISQLVLTKRERGEIP